jgi:hypothetical protein
MSGFDNTSETVVKPAATLATYVLTNNDYDVLFLSMTQAVTATLPDPTKIQPGRLYRIYKDASAQTLTISSAGSATIDGGASTTLATGAVHAKAFLTDGTNWFTITSY